MAYMLYSKHAIYYICYIAYIQYRNAIYQLYHDISQFTVY